MAQSKPHTLQSSIHLVTVMRYCSHIHSKYVLYEYVTVSMKDSSNTLTTTICNIGETWIQIPFYLVADLVDSLEINGGGLLSMTLDGTWTFGRWRKTDHT